MKRGIVTFLFLVYYLLYVVSPLYYTDDSINEDSVVTHASRYKILNVRIIWEIIFSRLSHSESKRSCGSGIMFFIKKTRAILNSNNPVRDSQQECIISSFDTSIFEKNPLIPLFLLPEVISQKGFYSSFSGLSPPHV